MTEKKPKKEKLEIKTRVPQKRVGIFDNLGKGKQQNVKHPFSEIVNFPAEISDTRTDNNETSENRNLGHPSKQISEVLTPEIQTRTPEITENSDIETPELLISGTREKEKLTRKNYDASYELKRKQNTSIDRMNLRPSVAIGRQIRVFCAEQGLELTEFFQLAALSYIEKLGHPENKISDTKTSHDDRRLKILYRTTPSLINLYLEINSIFNPKTRWTARDDDAAHKFNDVDLRLIELGIIQTLSNKNFTGKINSFGYFINEIQTFIDLSLPDESIEAVLQINRRRLEMVVGKSAVKNEQ